MWRLDRYEMIPAWLSTPDPEIYLGDNYVVLDWETTNINKGDPKNPQNRIVMSSYYCGPSHPHYNNRIHSVWGGEFQQGELLEAINKADFIVAQNTKFELQWLVRCGLELHKVLPYDTILGKYVQDGNRIRPRNLNAIATAYGIRNKESLVDTMIKGGVCPSEIPKSLLQRYCEQDVRTTLQVFLKQRKDLHEAGLLPVAFTRNIFTPVIADLELTGMYLDRGRVQKFHTEYSAKLAQINAELGELTGGINPRSGPQVAHFLYEDLGFQELKDRKGFYLRNKPSKQFPNGAPKTDAGTLLALKATTKKQKLFVSLKNQQSKLAKSVNTYLSRFLEACESTGCVVHGKFNQSVTQTHRLSSSSPNMQNFDRGFKQLFTARNTGWKIGERDAAQLEFRVAAFLGQDAQAIKDIKNEEDVHGFTASIIYSNEWAKVASDTASSERKSIRTSAKAHTFKPLYGGTSGTTAEKRYYKAFKEKYKGIAQAQEGWVNDALLTKEQVISTGLKFYWPHIKMTRTGYIEGNTNVRNYPVQNLATAEIIPIGVTYTWHHMKEQELQSFLINTVHDSMITEELPEETEELNDITEQAFGTEVPKYLQTVYNIDFNIPLDIDVELFNNWSSD